MQRSFGAGLIFLAIGLTAIMIALFVTLGVRPASADAGVQPVPGEITKVVLLGSTTGLTATQYTFTAAVRPADATLPILYTWSATGQTLEQHTTGITDTITYVWDSLGVKTIILSANNIHGTTNASYAIFVIGNFTGELCHDSGNDYCVFMPVIGK